MWMTVRCMLILLKMLISLIFGKDTYFYNGWHSRMTVLTSYSEWFSIKCLPWLGTGNITIPAKTVMVEVTGRRIFLQNIFSTKMQWSTQWDIPVPVSWCLLEKRLGTASAKSTLTGKTSAGSSQRFSVQKHSCLGEHFPYRHTPPTFHYTVLHPALTNRHGPAGAAK